MPALYNRAAGPFMASWSPAGAPASMTATYFVRYRMAVALTAPPLEATLPSGFQWVAWDHSLLETHAEVKYRSFLGELDAVVFPQLGTYEGCLEIMREVVRREGFLPQATWLVQHVPTGDYCGTIQGVEERPGVGAIQNLGVVQPYRRLGLGRALMLQALRGFYTAGLKEAHLEVTAENLVAVRLYEQLGFRTISVWRRRCGRPTES
jgi:mycothiol synthase